MTTDTALEKPVSAQKSLAQLPEEKFWKRYSPHSELPLSAIGSFALHFLGIGLLILLAWLGWLGFRKNSGAVPVDVVRAAPDGDRKKEGLLNDRGLASRPDAVEPTSKPDDNHLPPNPDPNRPKIDPNAAALAPGIVPKEDAGTRRVQIGNPNIGRFGEIERTASNMLGDGQPGKGDGGKDKRGTLTQSGPTPRMLRWTMIFNTRSGADYLSQLRGMGAVLAVPTGADNKSYKIIRDLSGQRTPQLLDEDISKIQGIYWIDKTPDSVRSLSTALRLGFIPNQIVAFMPRELEEKLYEMEKRAANGVPEEKIDETQFDVVKTPRGYEPRVISVKTRP